jgi:hypothetical protein
LQLCTASAFKARLDFKKANSIEYRIRDTYLDTHHCIHMYHPDVLLGTVSPKSANFHVALARLSAASDRRAVTRE